MPCWVIDTAFFVQIKDASTSPELAFLLLDNIDLSDCVGDSAIPGLNREAVHSKIVSVPVGQAAKSLTARVRPLLELSTTATVESRTLAALRDTLLPELMSGRLRVRDAEKVAEEAV
jgi:type I restriction enzyme S subunit